MDRFPAASPIGLDDIPKHSEWPGRILGEVDWTVPDRDIDKIEEEYEQEKYRELLRFQEASGTKNPDDIKEKQVLRRTWHFSESADAETSVCISEDSKLYVAPVLSAQEYNDRAVVETLERVIRGGETVVELGCGYGYNLHVLNQAHPTCEYIGGEYSENAVELAGKLFEGVENVSVEQFNYYDDSWPLFDRSFENDVIVFTRLSIEQLPQCGTAIESLRVSAGEALRDVVHLEPVYEMHDSDSLLQLLRKKYIEINDYNRDLLTVLEDADDVAIHSTEYDVFGFNGLNPMSLVWWRPE